MNSDVNDGCCRYGSCEDIYVAAQKTFSTPAIFGQSKKVSAAKFSAINTFNR
jgi:hypothetical protein